MLEILVALGVMLVLASTAVLPMLWPWEQLLVASLWLLGGGMAFGLPPAIVYHAALVRALRGRGIPTPRILWSPVEHHRLLPEEEARRIWPWFVAGGVGFLVVMAGCVLLALGLLRVGGSI